jgi:hypothetical protein
MNNLINKIESIPNLYTLKGCSIDKIEEAKEKLKINFSKEYTDYLLKYGAISFYGTEWTGLDVDEYIDVVETTKKEREINDFFPSDCFVIENIAIDGIVIVSDEKGIIYSVEYEKKSFLCDNLCEYLDMCLLRNNKHGK